jgi:hypothetical protein
MQYTTRYKYRKYSAAMYFLSEGALEALCEDHIESLEKCNTKNSITAVVRQVNI